MRIHTVLCARNEADVLEAYVRHSVRWSDKISIVLHRCQDNSGEILDHLIAEGLPVEYVVDDRLLHEHGALMTDLSHRAAREGADWILPLDADEFLVGSVKETFRNHPRAVPIEVPWRCYIPLPADDVGEPNVLRRIKHRRAAENPQWSKILVPGDLFRASEVYRLGYGCHQLFRSDQVVQAKPTSLRLAHFPVRSPEQISRKVFGGWLSNLADVGRPLGNTFQWKAVFEECIRGSVSLERIRDIAFEYATYDQWNRLPTTFRRHMPGAAHHNDSLDSSAIYDPVPCDFHLQCGVQSATASDVLIQTAEALAAGFGVLYQQRNHKRH